MLSNEEISRLTKENEELKKSLQAKDVLIESKDILINELKIEISEKSLTIADLKKIIEGKRKKEHDTSSEKSSQITFNLFNEAEDTAVERPELKLEDIIISYKRKKQSKKRTFNEKYDGLPVERVVLDHQTNCDICDSLYTIIGEKVTRTIEVVPARVFIKETVTKTVKCNPCSETNDAKDIIVNTDADARPIKGGVAGSSLLANIICDKYFKALPLYRQEKILLTHGIDLKRKDMSRWILNIGNLLLKPITAQLQKKLLSQDIVMADETGLKVIKAKGGSKSKRNAWMWVFMSNPHKKEQVVMFEYDKGRGNSVCHRILGDEFRGYLQTDIHGAYNKYANDINSTIKENEPPQITQVSCLAHIRRKFHDIYQVLSDEQINISLAPIGYDYCNRMFEVERQIREKNIEDTLKYRATHLRPIYNDFLKWLNKHLELTQKGSAINDAISYAYKHTPKLVHLFDNAQLQISNNLAEQKMKVFAVGRKNFLFSFTESGASASATLYSIIETCVQNNVKPFEYMNYIIQYMANRREGFVSKDEPLDDHMPYSDNIKNMFPYKKSSS